MGIWRRRRDGADLSGLIHHCDRGVRYRAIRYTERLADEAAVASVGSRGDSYDSALFLGYLNVHTGLSMTGVLTMSASSST